MTRVYISGFQYQSWVIESDISTFDPAFDHGQRSLLPLLQAAWAREGNWGRIPRDREQLLNGSHPLTVKASKGKQSSLIY